MTKPILRICAFILVFASIQMIMLQSSMAAVATDELTESSKDSAQLIPFKQDGSISTETASRFAVAVFVSLLVTILLIILLRRHYLGQGLSATDKHKIILLESKKLTPKSFVFLLRYAGNDYLLTQAGDNLRLIDKSPLDLSQVDKTENNDNRSSQK